MSLLFKKLSESNFTLRSNFTFDDVQVYDSSIRIDNECVKVSVPNAINSCNLFSTSSTTLNSDLIKSIEKVLNDHAELLISCIMVVHGTTYSNSLRLINNTKEYLKTVSLTNEETSDIQINVNSENLFQLIAYLCMHSSRKLILAIFYNNRNLLLASVFLDLLFKINSKYSDTICLLPVNSNKIYSESLLTTNFSRDIGEFKNGTILNKNRKTGFVILDDCDIFSATVSCCETMPNICFIHESVYQEFLIQLKQLNNHGKKCILTDKNRNWEMRLCSDTNKNKLNKLGQLVCHEIDNSGFIPAFMTDEIQPSNELFMDTEFNEIGTYLLTFRHINELISLLNTVPILNRSELYLWSENIQVVHSLNDLINWEHVFVNSTVYDILSVSSKNLYLDVGKFICPNSNESSTDIEKLISYFKALVPSKTFNSIARAAKLFNDLKLQRRNAEITSSKEEHISLKARGNVIVSCDDRDTLLYTVILSAACGNKTLAITLCDIDSQLSSLFDEYDLSKSIKFVNRNDIDVVGVCLNKLPIQGMVCLGGKVPFSSNSDLNCHFPILIAGPEQNTMEFICLVNHLYIPRIQNFDTK